MTKGYTGADRAIAYLFDNATEVSFRQIETGGTPIGEITIDGQSATIYTPSNAGTVKDVLVDGVSVVDQNGDAQLDSSDFGTPVEANPVESPTDDLSTIKIGDTVYDIPGGGGGSSYLASDFYSTDEQVVGSWTDDKPVYQKTIALSSLSAGANNVLITDLEHIVSSKSFIIHNNTDYLEVPFFGENYSSGVISEQACYVYSQAGKVVLFINSELLTDYTKAVLTVQYTKSTDAAGTAPTKNNLIYIPALYSERERQVGVWIDGKPLYQKTTILTGTYTGNMNNVDFGLGDRNIDALAFTQMIGIRSNNSFLPIPFYNPVSPNDGAGYVLNTDRSVTLRLGSIEYAKLELTIRYTKTTDQPGSGKWTPEGQFSHHYSTSEKIVGTWIDGSTVYEKTIPIPAIQSAQSGVLISNLGLNIDKCVDIKVRLYKDTGVDNDTVIATASFGDMYFYYRKSEDSIRMDAPFSWVVGRYGNITIQYTKSSS